jgi:hypothetical protein
MLQSSITIACEDETDTSLFMIHYDVIATDPYADDYVRVEVYEFDTVHRSWRAIMVLNDESSYLQLDRSKGYQIWMSDNSKSKVIRIEPGYDGQYEYWIHANLTNDLCMLMTPYNGSYKVEQLEFDVITPYIFEDQILD